MQAKSPVSDTPPGYRLVHHFILTHTRTLIWLNIIGTLLFVLALAVVFSALLAYDLAGSPLVNPALPEALPAPVYLVMLIGTLILHEALHGLAIALLGHRPRFGMKLTKLVLFTTSDAYFTRTQYLAVTLAPLIGITLLGIPAMLVLPQGSAIWIGIMVAVNTASAIGDMWMAAVTASFPADTLFHDESDGMSVFLPRP
jgi:hypothetical protein